MGTILIPYSVVSETTNKQKGIPDWITVTPVELNDLNEVKMLMQSAGLHRGEAECIVLVRNINATWFLTDDSGARYCAGAFGIEVHGTLGIILYNAAMGYIDKAQAMQALKKIRNGTLYLSEFVFQTALGMLEKVF